MGSAVNFHFFTREWACGFRFARHVVDPVPCDEGVFKGKPFLFTVTSLLPFYRCHFFFFLAPDLAAALHSHERSTCLCTSSASLIVLQW
jgi:hypothetical protein